MSYMSIAQSVNSLSLSQRITAAAAAELVARGENATVPEKYAAVLRWPVSATSDIAAAYEYALNSGNPDPGGDPTVITDQMILSAVQANWPAAPLP